MSFDWSRSDDFGWLSRVRRSDLIFNLCEGIGGHSRYEDFVVSTLELTGVPYTGCKPWAVSVAHRKHVANTLLSRYKNPQTFITGVEFVANRSDTLAQYVINLDVSSRVYVKETVTGVAGYFYVNNLEYTLERGKILRVRLGLVPANTTNIWLLGDATLSILGSTTIPNMYI